MTLDDFDYECPPHCIAQEPLKNRSECKLLCLKTDSTIEHLQFKDLINLIPSNALLVLNDTKVVPARIPILRASGAKGEMLIQHATESGDFIAMGRPSKRLKRSEKVTCFKNENYKIECLENLGAGNWRINFIPKLNYPDELHLVGEIPLPPYIERKNGPSAEDCELYQTVFAKQPGSAAAPTASLHFTPELLKQLSDKGVEIEKVTLHVGSGTFLPVRCANLDEHKMHSEYFEISAACSKRIQAAKQAHRPIIAVGTTVVRTLESCADAIFKGEAAKGHTEIFIKPPYSFKIIDELITNFHLPKSTLLMLVSSLCGIETLKHAYQAALKNDYRFFSYGDAMYLQQHP